MPITISGFDPTIKSYQSIFQKSNDTNPSQKFFLDTKVLVDPKSQQALLGMFNSHVKDVTLSQQQGKVYEKLINHHWEKLYEDTTPTSANFKQFVEAIENQTDTIHLIECTMNGENVIFGGYCRAQIPALANFSSESDYQIPYDEANFVFYYKNNESHLHFTMLNNKPFGFIYTDYESGGAMSITGDFLLISWS